MLYIGGASAASKLFSCQTTDGDGNLLPEEFLATYLYFNVFLSKGRRANIVTGRVD